MRRKLMAVCLSVAMSAVIFSGCSKNKTTDTEEKTEINLFLAASLEDSFKEIIPVYEKEHPEVEIIYQADSSGTLMTQIQEGYECDIFFSADTKQMDILEDENMILEGKRKDILENELVIIAGKENGTKVRGLSTLDKAGSIALADGSVPVGKYTRQAMVKAGILEETEDIAKISTKEIMEVLGTEINECSNVSKVKEAVKEGACEVGTVYYTDAYSVLDDVTILEHVDKDLTGEIIYPVGMIHNTEADEVQRQAAEDFYEYIQSEESLKVFEKYLYGIHEENELK